NQRDAHLFRSLPDHAEPRPAEVNVTSRLLNNQWKRPAIAHADRPDFPLRRAPQEIDLLGQTDRDERTARALGAVLERRRNHSGAHALAHLPDQLQGTRHELLGESDTNALACLGEVEDALVAVIPVLAKQKPLRAQLHAFRLPRSLGDRRFLSALVVDRAHAAAAALDEINDGD